MQSRIWVGSSRPWAPPPPPDWALAALARPPSRVRPAAAAHIFVALKSPLSGNEPSLRCRPNLIVACIVRFCLPRWQRIDGRRRVIMRGRHGYLFGFALADELVVVGFFEFADGFGEVPRPSGRPRRPGLPRRCWPSRMLARSMGWLRELGEAAAMASMERGFAVEIAEFRRQETISMPWEGLGGEEGGEAGGAGVIGGTEVVGGEVSSRWAWEMEP